MKKMVEKEEKKNTEPTIVNATEKVEDEKFLCFTKELIPCKLLFFTLDASFSSLFSFLGLYYLSSGLTVTQLGLINGIGSGFSLIAHPLWGGLVDSAIKHRTLLLISLTIGTTVLEFGKPWVVMFFSKTETIYKCIGNNTVVHSAMLNATANCTSHAKLLNPDTVFYAAAINGVFSSIVISGLMTYLEGAVIKTVFTRKKEHSYGEQKVFGPIGMALGSFVAGVAVDHYHPTNGLSPFLAAFYIYLPLSLLQIPLLYVLTKQAKWDYGTVKKDDDNKKGLIRHVVDAFKIPYNQMFLASVFICGITSCIYGNFLFIYMYQVMNPPKTVMSLMTVASSVSELFIYPFSSKLIKLFGGHMRCIITGMSLYSVRLVVLSFARSPWAVLPLSLMGGVAQSLAWTAMIEKTWMIFPKQITNTAIGILVTFHYTTPSILSNVFGAMLYHHFGGVSLFRVMAAINAVWCLIMFLYYVVGNKSTQSNGRKEGGSKKMEIELKEKQAAA